MISISELYIVNYIYIELDLCIANCLIIKINERIVLVLHILSTAFYYANNTSLLLFYLKISIINK